MNRTRTRRPTAVFTEEDIYSGSLLLVSARHPLPDACTRLALETVGHCNGRPVKLAGEAARMLRLLLAASGGEGCIRPISGYRSRAEQQSIFEETLRTLGEDYTRKYVALPGCSEHETGLAIDLGEAGSDFVAPSFPNTGAFARFARLAALYGFICRYPEGKSHITGIAHEPWHFRYVGCPHAAIMQQRGYTLEEYIDELAKRRSPKTALVHHEPSYSVRIFTLFPGEGGLGLFLPEGSVWQAGGNNVSGVVLSLWE